MDISKEEELKKIIEFFQCGARRPKLSYVLGFSKCETGMDGTDFLSHPHDGTLLSFGILQQGVFQITRGGTYKHSCNSNNRYHIDLFPCNR